MSCSGAAYAGVPWVIGSDWSEWSAAYTQPGAEITSPSLRRFIQVQARLKADLGAEPPALNRISLAFDDPSVQGLAGEIWPQDATPGRLDTFSVFVRAGVVEQPIPSAGYDEVRLIADPGLDMELIDVALGTEEVSCSHCFSVTSTWAPRSSKPK